VRHFGEYVAEAARSCATWVCAALNTAQIRLATLELRSLREIATRAKPKF